MNARDVLRDLIECGFIVELVGPERIEVEHEGRMTDAQRQAIRAHKSALVALLKQSQEAASDVLMDFFHITAPWRQAAKDYQQHANACPHCAAAGRGYGRRCAAGQQLWATYEDRQTNPQSFDTQGAGGPTP